MPGPKVKSQLSPRAKPRRHEFGVVKGGSASAPPCPAKLGGTAPLASTIQAWDRLWRADVAGVIDLRSDTESVVRWAALLDERERAFRAYRRQRIVEGSQGQPTLSPLWAVVRACDTELRALEDRIGLSPKARLQLGITYAEAGKSLDELNRMMEDGDDDGDGDTEAARDPRLTVIDATAS